MLTLYYKPACAFCQSVIAELEVLGLKANLKDVTSDSFVADELIRVGGKKQTPALVDDAKNQVIFDSAEIIKYLFENYGKSEGREFNGLRVHQSEEVCETCQ